jgi:hypothetical protein
LKLVGHVTSACHEHEIELRVRKARRKLGPDAVRRAGDDGPRPVAEVQLR